MQPAWQCCTQLGSLPCDWRTAQRSQRSVGTGRNSYCHLFLLISSGPICFSSMPNLSGASPCSCWQAISHVWQPEQYS